jgi:hypothetical protein
MADSIDNDPNSFYTPAATPESKPTKGFMRETAEAVPRVGGLVAEAAGKTLRALGVGGRETLKGLGGEVATEQNIPKALGILGQAAQNWGQKVQQDFEISPETQAAHPYFAKAAGLVEGVAKILPLMALPPVVSKVAIPAAMGAEQFTNSYDTGIAHNLSEKDAAQKALIPALSTAATMAAMGPAGELAGKAVQGVSKVAGDVINKTITQHLKEFSAGALADTGVMTAGTVATAEAEKLTGIRPEAQPLKEAFSPESLIGNVLMAGAFRGVATVQGMKGMAGMRKSMENPEAPAIQRATIAAHIEKEIRKTDPTAADEFGKAASEAIQNKQPIPMGKPEQKADVELHDKVTDALKTHVDTGADLAKTIQEKTAPIEEVAPENILPAERVSSIENVSPEVAAEANKGYALPEEGKSFVGPDGVKYESNVHFGDEITAHPEGGGPPKTFNVTDFSTKGETDAAHERIKREIEGFQLQGTEQVPVNEGAYRNEPTPGEQRGGAEANGGNRPIEGAGQEKIAVGETRPAGEPGSTMRITREADPTYGDVLKYHDEKTGETLAVAEVKPDGTVGKISDAPGTGLEERTQARKEFAKATNEALAEPKLSLSPPEKKTPEGFKVENKTTYNDKRYSSGMGAGDEQLVASINGKDVARLKVTKTDGGFILKNIEVEASPNSKNIIENLYAQAVKEYGPHKGAELPAEEDVAVLDSLRKTHPDWFSAQETKAEAAGRRKPSNLIGDHGFDFISNKPMFEGEKANFKSAEEMDIAPGQHTFERTVKELKDVTLFHGTSTEINVKDITSGTSDVGYFTPSPVVASDYALKSAGENPAIYPVKVSVEKPYITTNHGEILTIDNAEIATLKKQGYDSIIYVPEKTLFEAKQNKIGIFATEKAKFIEVVPFATDQVKSTFEKSIEAKVQEPAQLMTDLLKKKYGMDATFTREEPKGDTAVAAKALSDAIGKELVILRQKPGEKSVGFSGAVWPNHADYIFVVAGTKNMLLSTTLHESLHTLKIDHPDLYVSLAETLKPELKNLDAREIKINEARAKQGYGPLKPEMVLEERIAELMGDQAVKPAFWDKLMEKSPEVVQRIYEVVKKIVDSLVEAFKGRVPNQDVSNAIKVRDILADHLGEYIKRTQEAKTPQEYAQSYDMAASLKEPVTPAPKFSITPQAVSESLRDNKFIKDDVKPALVKVVTSLKSTADQFQKGVAPGGRTKDAAKVQDQFREVLGGMWQKQYQAGAKLDELVKGLKGETSTVASVLDLMRSQGKTLADSYFAKLPNEENWDFIFKMQKVGPEGMTDPVQKAVGTFMKDMNDSRVRAIQDLDTGLLGHIDANAEGNENFFFAQYWKKPEETQKAIMIAISKRPLEGQKSFAHSRIFEDVYTGLDLGYELVSNNPMDLFFMKMGEMDKYIAAHTMLQGMEKDGLATLRPSDEFLPAGETNVLGTFGTVKRREAAPENWVATGLKDDQGNPTYQDEKGAIKTADFKTYKYGVREDVAQVINNYLSPSLYNNKYIGTAFTGYMNMANQLNQFQLGVGSLFHAGFTTGETVVTHMSLGMKAIVEGNIAKGLKYIITAPAEIYKNPMRGDQLLSEWANPGSTSNANIRNMPLLLEGLRLAGVRKEMDTRFQTHTTEAMINAWANGNKIGAAARAPFAMVEQLARPIMEWLVPRQKFGVFGEMYNYWLDEHPNASFEERRQASGELWNRVDSRLGQVNYDRLFVNNTAKNLLQASLRAPGWTGGTILELGGGFKDLGQLFKNIAAGKKPNMSDRTAYTLSLVLTTAITNGILTTLFTGEQPEGNDFLAFRTGNTDEHGFAERFMLPSYMKDMYAYWNDTSGTLGAKVHPAIGMIKNVAQNKDYYGTEIRHEGDNIAAQFSQVLGFTVKQYVPFWVRGIQKEQERGGTLAAEALPFVGIMPASAELNRTPAEKMVRQFMVARTPSMTKTSVELDRGKLVTKLTRRMRAGDATVEADIQDAVNNGEISTRAATQIKRDAQFTPLEVGFRRLSLTEAMKVMEKARPEEQDVLAPLLEKKQASQKKLYPNGMAEEQQQ